LTSHTINVYIVDMPPELLGTFELVVLLAVLGLDDEAYGRAVLRQVQAELGDERNVSAGAVYTTLDRVEAKGLLTSRVEEGTPSRGGRARRFYRLTASGAAALTASRQTLEKMWQGKPFPIEVNV
jgi:PadR family transcriptional regulator, regulatory protein PadR